MEEQSKTCQCGCGDNCQCGCKEGGECTCQCGCGKKWAQPKYIFIFTVILAITAIVIVSILRERIVNQQQNQVSVTGQGKVSYQPDVATVTLGVQIDKAATSEAALNQLNDKMTKIMEAVEALGVKKEDVTTEAYTLNPQYDNNNGTMFVSGYSANQKIAIKISDIQQNTDMISKVISAANSAGTNQVVGIDFSVSSTNDLEQQARVLAIQDAKAKSAELAKAAGVKLGKVEGWYENIIQPADSQASNMGYGGSERTLSAKAIPSPQVSSGTQDIIIEVNLNYEVK
jgi:uncharacterized protein